MMGEVRDSQYYAEQAERCRRLSRMMNDQQSIDELQKMADEYTQTAARLRSIERAKASEPVLPN